MVESPGKPPEVKSRFSDQALKAAAYFFYGTGPQKYVLAPVRFILWFPQVLLWRFLLAPTLNWIAVRTGLRRIPQYTRILVVLGASILVFFALMFTIPPLIAGPPDGEEMDYSDMKDLVDMRQVAERVTLDQRHTLLIPDKRFAVITDLRDGEQKWARVEIQSKDNELSSLEWWDSKGYKVRLTGPFPYSYISMLLLQTAPFFLIQIGLLWVFLGGGLRSIFAERTALKHALSERPPPVRLDQIGGLKKAKKESQTFIDMLKDPDRYKDLGVRMPKGLFIKGPPGVGKTLLAVAIPTEAEVNYYYISGSAFGQPLVGLGRDLVNTVRAHAELNMPAVVIIDEAEAVLADRGKASPLETSERGAITDSVLEWLEDIKKRDLPILMIALTNLGEQIDAAAQRPGRLDRHIVVGEQDQTGRAEILRIHFNTPSPIPLEEGTDVDALIKKLARITPRFPGADLALLTEEARLYAGEQGRKQVRPRDFVEVLPKVSTRSQESDFTLSRREKALVQIHEGGHTLLSWVLPGAAPARLAFARPHEGMGGATMTSDDGRIQTESQLSAMIKMKLGGYAIEKSRYGEVSSAPSGDLHSATKIARFMIFRGGMSEEIGPVSIDALTESRPDAWMHFPAHLAEEGEGQVQQLLKDYAQEMAELLRPDGAYYAKAVELAQALEREDILDEDQIREIVFPLLTPERIQEIEEMDAMEEDEDDEENREEASS